MHAIGWTTLTLFRSRLETAILRSFLHAFNIFQQNIRTPTAHYRRRFANGLSSITFQGVKTSRLREQTAKASLWYDKQHARL